MTKATSSSAPRLSAAHTFRSVTHLATWSKSDETQSLLVAHCLINCIGNVSGGGYALQCDQFGHARRRDQLALDVNNNQDATGNSLVPSDPGSSGSLLRAYRWTAGTMTNLGSMSPIPPSTSTNRFARGYAINDAGVVVG